MSSSKLLFEPISGPRELPQEEHRNKDTINMKPRYAWVWPKDGKRQNWWGRWKDIMSGCGPDIHVVISEDMRQRQKDWPSKAQWSKWNDLADSTVDGEKPRPLIRWARRGVDERYDFRKRKYIRPDKKTWTDAIWRNPSDGSEEPKTFRDMEGQYWEQQRGWPDPKDW